MSSGPPDAAAASPEPAGFRPTFIHDRPVTLAALAFATDAHLGDRREGDGAPFILHPIEVAALLSSWGLPDEVTAAGLLHDTVEDTATTDEELRARFGEQVAGLVRALTEDDTIPAFAERKAALRAQVAGAGHDVAMIYVADKLSKVRELRIRLSTDPAFATGAEGQAKLEHYWLSLEMLDAALGEHPVVQQFRFELEAIRTLPPRNASRAALERAQP